MSRVVAVIILVFMCAMANAADLVVVSEYGGAVPAVGTNSYAGATNIACSVTNSPVAIAPGIRASCLGWNGTGDVPASGTGQYTGEFGLTNNSSITWNWETQVFFNLSVPVGGGSIDAIGTWYAQNSTGTLTAVPDQYCGFLSWGGDTNGCSINGSQIDVPADAPRSITATFTGGPWANEVVSYMVGTNPASDWATGAPYTNQYSALGIPERDGTWGDITPFSSPYEDDEIVSIGSGGSLVVKFAQAVSNDAGNPLGADLIVFGNAFFYDTWPSTEIVQGLGAELGTIMVSQDGVTWHEVTTAKADGLFPSLGYTDTSSAYAGDGTTFTDFLKPVNTNYVYMGKTYAELVAHYNGAGGGMPVDIDETGLDWIQYVMITQALGQTWSTEIDGFADVKATGDADMDDLPDTWELEHFGDLATTDGSGNFDSDRWNDREEYKLGWDPLVRNHVDVDFDGDGASDLAAYNTENIPGTQNLWYIKTATGTNTTNSFGYSGTIPVTGDFDADGITDYGCYDPDGIPGTTEPGSWFVMLSYVGFVEFTFGYKGTVPVIGDFDGDGVDDVGLYDADGLPGKALPGSWYIVTSSEGFRTEQFGYAGTVPVVGDFDGDGTEDIGCYDADGIPGAAEPGTWYAMMSSNGFQTKVFGYSGTVPVVGDFDGDRIDDIGCYDASGIPGVVEPGSWYFMTSANGFYTETFGYAGTAPVVADYDGDGVDDFGCYDASGIDGYVPEGSWFLLTTTEGFFRDVSGTDDTIPVAR